MKTNNKKLNDFLIGLRAMFAQLKPSKLNNKTKALIAAGLLAGASACHDEPEPTREVVLEWDWVKDVPPMDTVKYYTKQPDVKYVTLYLQDETHLSNGFPPAAFHQARDTLQTRFDISEKVRGAGTVWVHPYGGAQLPDLEHNIGMAEIDSIWYAANGFEMRRHQPYTK